MKKTNMREINTPAEKGENGFPLIPPEVHFLANQYIFKLPMDDLRSRSPWELRVHVAKMLEYHLGDEVEMTGMKIKKPHLIAKAKARVLRREPYARAIVTIKF